VPPLRDDGNERQSPRRKDNWTTWNSDQLHARFKTMPTRTIAPTDTTIPLVDLKAQYATIKRDVNAAIARILDDCAFIGGPEITRFETDFAHYCGARHGVGTSSGTTALHLALCALGVGQGDEVIAPAHTFIATVEAVAQTGARVVFADVDEATYTLDPESVATCLSSRTRAIIPVHIYGQMADIAAIKELKSSCDHEIVIIEDAAQAHGARRDGIRAGGACRAGCFSFFPGKNLGAFGDAGMVTTHDTELADRCRKLANHGRQDKYRHDLMGFNYRLDALQAAILNVKLQHLAAWTLRRRSRAAIYDELLTGVPGVTLPAVADDAEHVYHLYVIQVDDREGLRAHLAECNIATGVHYPIPLHQQPAVRRLGFAAAPLPVTEALCERILSLPIYPEMTDDQVARVAQCVREYLA
jgi:dTDP-4-amino-4,6-dideoxygalactose transaminase